MTTLTDTQVDNLRAIPGIEWREGLDTLFIHSLRLNYQDPLSGISLVGYSPKLKSYILHGKNNKSERHFFFCVSKKDWEKEMYGSFGI